MADGDVHVPVQWADIPDTHWRAFFAEAVDHYMGQLERVRQGRRVYFNFNALLFGFAWLFFRKMYLVALCLLILMLVLRTVETVLFAWVLPQGSITHALAVITLVAPPILIGMFADRVYLWHAARVIREEMARNAVQLDQVLLARLAYRGGTSWTSVLVLFGGVFIVLFLITFFSIHLG